MYACADHRANARTHKRTNAGGHCSANRSSHVKTCHNQHAEADKACSYNASL